MRVRTRWVWALGFGMTSGGCADAPAPGVSSAPAVAESAPSARASVEATAPSATTTAAPSTTTTAWAFPPDPPSSAEVDALAEALRASRRGEPPLAPLSPQASASPLDRMPERPCDPSFCLRAVDDDVDHLRSVFAEHAPPAGMELAREDVDVGLGPRRGRWFLRATAPAPEALAEAGALAEAALSTGRVLAWGLEGGGALRSYVLGPAIVDAADLASARKTTDGVELVLRPAGQARLGEATAALARRRIAILTAGRVVSAPVVMSPITGGRLVLGVPPEEADRLLVTIAPR